MSNDKEMTLMMRIRANGGSALNRLSKDMESFGKAAKAASKDVGAIGGFVFAPLRMATTAAMALAGGLVAVGSAALYAAAEEEKLLARLTAVAGSATQGKKALDTFNKIARNSGFKTEDLAEAAIIMKQYGFDSQRSLFAVSKAARVAGVDVQVLALQTMALQARGLKRFGIEMEEGKDNPVLKFRNNAGKIMTIATRTADEARRKLLDIYTLKFGTNISPNTFSAFIQMLKSNLTQVMERLGADMLPAAKRFIDYISGGLNKAIESGKIDEWGKKAGAVLMDVVSRVMAFFDTLPALFEGIGKLLSGSFDGMKEVLFVILETAGQTLATALIEYLIAAKEIFFGLGKIIGAALAETIYGLDLPGMGGKRESAALRNINQASDTDLRGMAERLKVGGVYDADGNFKGDPREALKKYLRFSHDNKENIPGVSALASMDSQDTWRSGLKEMALAIPEAAARVKAVAEAGMGRVNNVFADNTGIDIGAVYKEKYAARKGEANRYGKERVTAQFTEYETPDRDKPWQRVRTHREETTIANKGLYQMGQQVGGGVVINIQNLTTVSNNAAQMARDIAGSAGRGAAVQAAY